MRIKTCANFRPEGEGKVLNTSDPPKKKKTTDGQVNNRIFSSRCASLRPYTAFGFGITSSSSREGSVLRRSNAFTDHCTRFRFHAPRSAQTITERPKVRGFPFFLAGPKIDSEMLLEANVKYGLHCIPHGEDIRHYCPQELIQPKLGKNWL